MLITNSVAEGDEQYRLAFVARFQRAVRWFCITQRESLGYNVGRFQRHKQKINIRGRAIEIRKGYGCSRSSDGLYLALAEELAANYDTEIVTFDKGFINQAAKNAPTVKINLLKI